jgi:hypothetical protein
MDHRTSTVRGLESLSGLDTTIGAIGVGDRPRQIPHSGWRKPALFLCNLAQVRRAHDALVRAAEKYEEWHGRLRRGTHGEICATRRNVSGFGNPLIVP